MKNLGMLFGIMCVLSVNAMEHTRMTEKEKILEEARILLKEIQERQKTIEQNERELKRLLARAEKEAEELEDLD